MRDMRMWQKIGIENYKIDLREDFKNAPFLKKKSQRKGCATNNMTIYIVRKCFVVVDTRKLQVYQSKKKKSHPEMVLVG